MNSLILSLIIWSSIAFGQSQEELITISVEGLSMASSAAEAAREIQAKLTSEVAKSQVIDLIGEKRYEKNRRLVDSRILKESARFIPFVKRGDPVQVKDGSWKLSLELKVALSSLRQMVLDAGLLSEGGEGQVSVLPLVGFFDRSAGISYRWWAQRSQGVPNTVMQIMRDLHSFLAIEFNRSGFYLISPPENGFAVTPYTEKFSLDAQSPQDTKLISQLYRSPLILSGSVKMRASPATPGAIQFAVKMSVQNVVLGRTAAEISRIFETDSGNAEQVVKAKLKSEFPEIARDLSIQMVESWKRGSLGANILSVSVRPLVSPKRLQDLRSQMLKNVKEVKAVRERLFELDHVVFEIDYAGGQGPQLAEKLKNQAWTGFELKIAEASEKTISLEYRARP